MNFRVSFNYIQTFRIPVKIHNMRTPNPPHTLFDIKITNFSPTYTAHILFPYTLANAARAHAQLFITSNENYISPRQRTTKTARQTLIKMRERKARAREKHFILSSLLIQLRNSLITPVRGRGKDSQHSLHVYLALITEKWRFTGVCNSEEKTTERTRIRR